MEVKQSGQKFKIINKYPGRKSKSYRNVQRKVGLKQVRASKTKTNGNVKLAREPMRSQLINALFVKIPVFRNNKSRLNKIHLLKPTGISDNFVYFKQ